MKGPKHPKTLNQVRKELGKLYWLLCHRPETLELVHGGVRVLGRMIDTAAVALLWSRSTGQRLPKHHERFIKGR